MEIKNYYQRKEQIIMKASTINGKRLTVVANEPILGDALHYKYLPVWKRLSEKLRGLFIAKFESCKKKPSVDFYRQVGQNSEVKDCVCPPSLLKWLEHF